MVEGKKRWIRRGAMVAAGVVVGLLLTEAAFWFRDDGAFPHLNLYQPDDELGARLRPGSSMRLRVGENPITSVRINRQGYRGEDWPEPGGREVLVVGDSQVMGLGVEEGETFSARLDELLGRSVRVLNAGVATYGPAEYRAVIREVGRERKPERVVLVFNMVNDLTEARRPNTERHAIWDGWAVRRETAPEQSFGFPLKSFLFNRSHAVFAARRYLARRDEATVVVEENTLPSEGTFADLVVAGQEADAARKKIAEENERHRRDFLARRGELEKKSEDIEEDVVKAMSKVGGRTWTPVGFDASVGVFAEIDTETLLRAARANPGDIVGEQQYAEGAGPYAATANIIRKGAEFRRKVAKEARRRLEAFHDARSKEAVESLDAVRAVDEELERLLAQAPHRSASWSPLKSEMDLARTLCDEWGAELTVVILPFDVQVSDDEWTKYGGEPVDVSGTLVLNEDAVRAARAAGARAVHPLEALRKAEPGAFLHGDLHLTPKGHEAVAQAIARTFEGPPPLPHPTGGLPQGRTRVPGPMEMASEAIVKGSSAARCDTYLRRGWFRGICAAHEGDVPRAVELKGDLAGEMVSFSVGQELSFLVPFVPGSRLEGYVYWTKHRRPVRMVWPEDADDPEMSIGDPEPLTNGSGAASTPAPAFELPADGATCGCAIELQKKREGSRPPWPRDRIEPNDVPFYLRQGCIGEVQSPSLACEATYGNDCEPLLACSNGDPWYAAECPDGYAHGGALERCLPLCDPKSRPCETGSCELWQGGYLCFPSSNGADGGSNAKK